MPDPKRRRRTPARRKRKDNAFDPRPEGVGAGDDNSGGGNATGAPDADTAAHAGERALYGGDLEEDRRALFPERFGPPTGSFEQFWHHYLEQHQDPRDRQLHVIGTAAGLACAAIGVAPVLSGKAPKWGWLLAAPVVGYAFSWLGHYGIEHSRPVTFGNPAWSLRADLRLLWRTLTGQISSGLGQSAARAAPPEGGPH